MQDKNIKVIKNIISDYLQFKTVFKIISFGFITLIFDILFVSSIKHYINLLTNINNSIDDIFYNLEKFSVVLLLIIVISFTLKILNSYIIFKFAEEVRFILSNKILSNVINLPPEYLSKEGLNYYKKIIVNEIDRFSEKVIAPIINSVIQTLIIIGVISYLIYLNWQLCVLVFFLIISFYLTLSIMVKAKLNDFSEKRLDLINQRLDLVDILINLNDELKESKGIKKYFSNFSVENEKLSKLTLVNNVISASPRFLLECFIFLLIVIGLYLMHSSGSNLTSNLPLITAFIFAFYKLIPSAQLLYNAFVLIESNDFLIKKIGQHLYTQIEMPAIGDDYKEFKLSDLNDLSSRLGLKIQGDLSKINIITGSSGVGKSTLFYELYKLLQCSKSFVKQDLKLINGNILENIILGGSAKEVEVLRLIKTFELDTIDKEKNLKVLNDSVSGGQKQRISLLRSIINKPEIIIIDEALSGLDLNIKYKIINLLKEINFKYIFIISHDEDLKNKFNCIEVLKKNTEAQ